MYSLNSLNIFNLNCQVIKGNLQYSDNILNNQCDIVFLCGHWFTIRSTYRQQSKWINLKSGMDDDDSTRTGRPYGGVGFITRKLQDVTTHDVPQDDARTWSTWSCVNIKV